MRRPVLGLAVAFGLGGLLTDGEAGPYEALALLTLAGALLGLALAVAHGRWVRGALAGAALAMGGAAAAVEGLQLEAGSLRRVAPRGRGQGRRPDPGRRAGRRPGARGRLVLSIDAESVEAAGRLEPCTGRARVEVGGETPRPRLLDGDRVAVWVGLRAARRADAVRERLRRVRLLQVGAPRRAGRGRVVAPNGRGPHSRSRPRLDRSLDAAGHRTGSRPRHGPGRPLGGGRGHLRGLSSVGHLPRPRALGRPGRAGGRADRGGAALPESRSVDAGRGDGVGHRDLRAPRGRRRAGGARGAHGLRRARRPGPRARHRRLQPPGPRGPPAPRRPARRPPRTWASSCRSGRPSAFSSSPLP